MDERNVAECTRCKISKLLVPENFDARRGQWVTHCRACSGNRTLAQRFWAKVRRGTTDECWEWQAYRSAAGYGRFGIARTVYLAHRVSFFLFHGRWPEPHCLHRCDNPRCVNPRHLFEGDDRDNVTDAMTKGRLSLPPRRLGVAHHATPFKDADVRAIRLAAADGKTNTEIARERGVSSQAIQQIVLRRTWKHIA